MSGRVSGWCRKYSIYPDKSDRDTIHVTEVPEGAIEGEAVVKHGLHSVDCRICGRTDIDLPAALIGKRVRYIIFEED